MARAQKRIHGSKDEGDGPGNGEQCMCNDSKSGLQKLRRKKENSKEEWDRGSTEVGQEGRSLRFPLCPGH